MITMKKGLAKKILFDLNKSLQKLCHAKNCTNLNACPVVCWCKKDRDFKLNHDTAACWELANITMAIYNQLEDSTLTPEFMEIKQDQAYLIRKLKTYHPTSKGWTKLYSLVDMIISSISVGMFHDRTYAYADCKLYLERINRMSSKLKRNIYKYTF